MKRRPPDGTGCVDLHRNVRRRLSSGITAGRKLTRRRHSYPSPLPCEHPPLPATRVSRTLERAACIRHTSEMGAGPVREEIASDYGMRALLAVRARFFLAYRLALRTIPFLLPGGGLRSGWWRLALVGFALLDVGQWIALRNPDRFGLKTRLVLDSLDVAFWSFAPYPSGLGPVWLGLPLALESGFRCRAKGLVVPAAILGTTAGLHAVVGRPMMILTQVFSGFSFFWLVLAVGWGILLDRYIGRLQRRTDVDCQTRRSAEYRRAMLAGQNSLAMGSSSVVDAIEATLPLLGPPQPGSVLWTFADAWKSELAASTAGCAAYLGQVLAEWASEFNTHPDLASRVEVACAEGSGTTVLTEEQGLMLRQLLSDLGLRGPVLVELIEPNLNGPPGHVVRLRVNATPVEIPADPASPPRPYDPAPAVFLIAAGLMIADLVGYPLRPLGSFAGLSLALGAAWWADRQLRRRGASARGPIVVVTGVVAVSYTVAATLSLVHSSKVAGIINYPVVAGLDLLGLLSGMYWRTLSQAARAVLVGSAALVLASCWLAHPPPNDAAQLLISAVWPVPLLLATLRLDRELDAGARRYADKVLADDRALSSEAFARGQTIVAELVRRAVTEARLGVRALGSTLSPEVAETIRRRLGEVDRRLDSLKPSTGLSSSTTTS
jgi:hypothetical protein